MSSIETNSIKAWLLASRPKTLAAAVTPVVVGCALAYHLHSFEVVPAVICLLFAVLMQVAANLINDLIDYKNGTDGEERLGPQRATAQGWITPEAMKKGIITVVAVACLIGLSILFVTDRRWEVIATGLACVVFAYLYTSGPYPLSYNGFGDVAVVVFFGIVPVCITCLVQANTCPLYGIALSVGVGLAINCLLVVNNYRDRDTDKASGKRTIIVKLGETFGRYFYLANGLSAGIIGILALLSNEEYWNDDNFLLVMSVLFVPYLTLHSLTWCKLVKIRSGKSLNALIGESSRNMLVYAILTTIGLALWR